jgi:hypothetical protein
MLKASALEIICYPCIEYGMVYICHNVDKILNFFHNIALFNYVSANSIMPGAFISLKEIAKPAHSAGWSYR